MDAEAGLVFIERGIIIPIINLEMTERQKDRKKATLVSPSTFGNENENLSQLYKILQLESFFVFFFGIGGTYQPSGISVFSVISVISLS